MTLSIYDYVAYDGEPYFGSAKFVGYRLQYFVDGKLTRSVLHKTEGSLLVAMNRCFAAGYVPQHTSTNSYNLFDKRGDL